MQRWIRCRNTPAVAWLAIVALAGAAWLPLPAFAAGKIVARVNEETITEAALERAVEESPGVGLQKVLDGLIEESLIVQEARRQKFDQSDSYQRAVRGWRQQMAVALIGIDTLRRHVVKTGEKLTPFPEFYSRWESVYAALSPQEKANVDAQVEARLAKMKSAVSAYIDVASLEKYAAPLELPLETTRKVIATQTTWGPITLADILAEEPRNLDHIGQSTKEVVRMWQQIAREIVGRNYIVQNAETAGLFAVEGLQEEENRARRELLKTAFLNQHYSKISKDALLARVDQELASWTSSYALAVEEITLPTANRVDASRLAKMWKEDGKAPSGLKVESFSLSLAWPRLTLDQKRVLLDERWGSYLPPLRAGSGFLLLHLMAATPPQQQETLGALAEPLLAAELYRELTEKLARSARIKME